MPVHDVVTNEPSRGSITGPTSGLSTDNAVARWDGTNADTMQNSLVTIDDSGNIVSPTDVSAVSHTFSGTGGVKVTAQTYIGTNSILIGNKDDATAPNNAQLVVPAALWIVSRWGTGTNWDTYGRWSAAGGLGISSNSNLSFYDGFVSTASATARFRFSTTAKVTFDNGALGSATIHGPLATGSNSAANDLILGSGVSTGNATPGKLIIQTTVAGASSSTSQTLANFVTFQGITMSVAGHINQTVGNFTIRANGQIFWDTRSVLTSPADGELKVEKFDGTDLLYLDAAATTRSLGTTAYLHVPNLQADGVINPASLADSAAGNNSIYFSTDANKLVYKDSGGVVNNLY